MCGGTLPLPRATARVAPTKAYLVVRRAGMVGGQKDRADTSVSALRLREKPAGFFGSF